MDFKFYFLSETAITVQWSNEMSNAVYERVLHGNQLLQEKPFEGFVETVPAYATLTVFYRPERVILTEKSPAISVQKYIQKLLNTPSNQIEKKKNEVLIPVCYDTELGLDLEYIAQTKRMSIAEVINCHQTQVYKVYMMGFLPGFPYMGKVNDAIATARKHAPRPMVEAGSVGIAGNQTGIYPLASPGGWQIIGRTPLNLFDIQREIPFLIQAGDSVRFYAISKEEFDTIKKEVSTSIPQGITNSDMVVLKLGVFSTFQDEGRVGFRSYGVPCSGAMDVFSHHIANALLGNAKTATTIECTMGGLVIQFNTMTQIAITGAGNALVNGKYIALSQVHEIQSGDVLEIQFANLGLRTYVAVRGGFASQKIMNSRSVASKIGIGTALKKGMGIQLGEEYTMSSCDKLNQVGTLVLGAVKRIRVIEGQEMSWVANTSKEQFYSESFTISNRSDRMGYHLQGKSLLLANSTQLLSTAVTQGTIQLTPKGQMIVLMSDCQTTGGYPRIGQVIAVDLPILAQMKPNEVVCFEKISFEEAEKLYLTQQKIYDDYFG